MLEMNTKLDEAQNKLSLAVYRCEETLRAAASFQVRRQGANAAGLEANGVCAAAVSNVHKAIEASRATPTTVIASKANTTPEPAINTPQSSRGFFGAVPVGQSARAGRGSRMPLQSFVGAAEHSVAPVSLDSLTVIKSGSEQKAPDDSLSLIHI